MRDQWNALMDASLVLNATGSGALDGRTFAVKDVFAIQNVRNSAGNPDWLRTHPPSDKSAPVIDALLKQGARLQGTTHTDELMYSLNGENHHYGTPVNPRLPDRIPGGSSSGSASAVAAGLTDFALGTDTGGSVRIPSSYCGLYGFRPTHGLVDISGVIPLAKSFDTVGWMSRDPHLLLQTGSALIQSKESIEEGFDFLYFDKEVWSFIEEEEKEILIKAVSSFQALAKKSETIILSEEGLFKWGELFRTIQGIEIWEEHRDWITSVHPAFGPGISDRFEWASSLNRDELPQKQKERKNIKECLSHLLQHNGLLVIPTAPGEAPKRNLPAEALERTRTKTMQLTCIAGLAGFPQVTIPILKANGAPIGLSFIANENQDLRLLSWIERVTSLENSAEESKIETYRF
ncbi:amidase [Peribacillus kribbensis]|uniref:amidase n=1 Tax=Peribacillus kribbensis TaxID=356658 RepID=UPI00041C762B|nr:amidase [Peribacillus kribbensis]